MASLCLFSEIFDNIDLFFQIAPLEKVNVFSSSIFSIIKFLIQKIDCYRYCMICCTFLWIPYSLFCTSICTKSSHKMLLIIVGYRKPFTVTMGLLTSSEKYGPITPLVQKRRVSWNSN